MKIVQMAFHAMCARLGGDVVLTPDELEHASKNLDQVFVTRVEPDCLQVKLLGSVQPEVPIARVDIVSELERRSIPIPFIEGL
jgi:hypothetical protein